MPNNDIDAEEREPTGEAAAEEREDGKQQADELVSNDSRVRASSVEARPISYFKIATLLFAALAALLTLYFGIVEYKNREEERRLSIVRDGSQVTYEWESNYLALLYEGGNLLEAAKRMEGTLWIRNHLAEPISGIQIKVWIGVDPDLIKYPYRFGPKGRSVYETGHALIEPNQSLEIPVIQRARDAGFELQAILRSDPDKWNQFVEDWTARLTQEAPTVDIGSADVGSAPSFDESQKTVKALFGRVIVEFQAGARKYLNILTLAVGYASSEDSVPALWITPKGFPSNPVVTFASQVSKQGYSRVTSPGGRIDILLIPQLSYSKHTGLAELLPARCQHNDIRAENTTMNRFTFTLILCDQR